MEDFRNKIELLKFQYSQRLALIKHLEYSKVRDKKEIEEERMRNKNLKKKQDLEAERKRENIAVEKELKNIVRHC